MKEPEYVEPVVEKDHSGTGTRVSHPSFGVVRVSRTSGYANLFGSKLRHMHFMSLSIGPAEQIIGDSGEERTYSAFRGQLIEIQMSEVQWAQLLSSINMGDGVPCTLKYVNAKRIPECPIDDVKGRFENIVKEDARAAVASLESLRKEIAARFEDPRALTKKEKGELLGRISNVIMEVSNNMPFVQEMMQETLEKQVTAAKMEIDSHLQHRAQQLGFKNIQDQVAALQLEAGDATKQLSEGYPYPPSGDSDMP